MREKNILKRKIDRRQAKICIIGLGYVGLPLGLEFAKAGFKVYGLDTDQERLSSLKRGKSYIDDVSNDALGEALQKKNFRPVGSYTVVKNCDCIIICVPTPLGKTKEPDISFIINCFNKLVSNLKKEQMIILESTTYPGTTREILAPRLKENGFKLGKDIYLCFSPERIDPGNKVYTPFNIPKVIGAVDNISAEIGAHLYKQITEKVIIVSSSDVAEMVKLLENTFRAVNIGLANEMQLMCHKLGLDIWEVIEAASTKPYGFMPFYPGPGLGGHCIPVDPMYLSWRAKLSGFEPRLIDIAQQVNAYMPQHVVERMATILNQYKKPLNNSKILVIGVSYKKDVKDTRESPALEIISLLREAKSRIDYYDPYVEEINVDGKILKSKKITRQNLSTYDLVCIVTNHSNINYQLIVKFAKVIFDTRNALKNFRKTKKIFKL
jgi:UDP-N-acetyl-D-glucosamine dehydrogenase